MLGFGFAGLRGNFAFGLTPALRASSVKPASALKGGEDPHSRPPDARAGRAQVAFCVIVHFVAGLFVASFDRLSNQPVGFSAARILNLETVTQRPQSPVYWEQVIEHLRAAPGVETVALTIWPLMSGETVTARFDRRRPSQRGPDRRAECLSGLVRCHEDSLPRRPRFSGGDTNPSVAIVNQAFAKQYFEGQNPVGKSFE